MVQKKVRRLPAMIRHGWIGAYSDLAQRRHCVLIGLSSTTVYAKRRPVVFIEIDAVLAPDR